MPKKVKLIGVPSFAGAREETSCAIDQHNGPRAVRHALTELYQGFDIPVPLEDVGDLPPINTVPELLDAVEERVFNLISEGTVPFILGGAHTLTLGTLRALKRARRNFSLIYIDAHPDIMPHPHVNYGSSIYYALEEKVVDERRVAFIGIRQVERAEWEVIGKKNLFHIPARDFSRVALESLVQKISSQIPPPYLMSFDLDALDPTFAPGVTSPFPCGLSPREVLFVMTELCHQEVLGIEIVELSPINDPLKQTARIAAFFVQQLATLVTSR